jgi:hypothetical protein
MISVRRSHYLSISPAISHLTRVHGVLFQLEDTALIRASKLGTVLTLLTSFDINSI